MAKWAHAVQQVLDPLARPAVAPQGLRTVLAGDRARWEILGATSAGCWCAHGESVVILSSAHIVGLPNEVGALDPGGALLDPEGHVWMGRGLIESDSAVWRVTRWWDSRPPPAPIAAGSVADLLQLGGWEQEHRVERFVDGHIAGEPERAFEAALSLIGKGRGLTPEGDDLLLGAISVLSFGGEGCLVSTLSLSRTPVLEAARTRTTRLSRSLLEHAYRGEVARPLGSLLMALTGRGDLGNALRSLIQVGASSGEAWARGVASAAARLHGGVT